jgi:hypothetical protein
LERARDHPADNPFDGTLDPFTNPKELSNHVRQVEGFSHLEPQLVCAKMS